MARKKQGRNKDRKRAEKEAKSKRRRNAVKKERLRKKLSAIRKEKVLDIGTKIRTKRHSSTEEQDKKELIKSMVDMTTSGVQTGGAAAANLFNKMLNKTTVPTQLPESKQSV